MELIALIILVMFLGSIILSLIIGRNYWHNRMMREYTARQKRKYRRGQELRKLYEAREASWLTEQTEKLQV